MNGILIELDARRRMSLGRIGRVEHTRYLASEQPDGTVSLTPAVVMSEAEARILADPALADPALAKRIQARRNGPKLLRPVPDVAEAGPILE